MKTYKTTQAAPYGLYMSAHPIDVRVVGATGEALEGLPDATYRRIPTPLALSLSPLLGAGFVIAFPVLILAAVATGVLQLLLRPLHEVLTDHAWLASPRWQPAASYLAKGDKPKAKREPEELAELRKAVDEQRRPPPESAP